LFKYEHNGDLSVWSHWYWKKNQYLRINHNT